MLNSKKTFVVYGASKGLGKAMIEQIPDVTDKVYAISRSCPQNLSNLNWICADLSYPIEAVNTVKNTLQNQKIDILIYNVGIWEQDAFTPSYDFSKVSSDEIIQMMNTNINTCILSIQALLDNLKLSENGKIILIGSTWGVDNHNGKELIFSASKFALRGIAQSLREILREYAIGVSILNLGYLATEVKNTDTQQILEETDYALIPLIDVIQAIRFIISTTKATCVKEILMPAMKDINV